MTMVMQKYMEYSSFAVIRILGTSFPTEGPGLSALHNMHVVIPCHGRIARMNTRIPIPPIQWEKLLHIRVAWDISSTLGIILEPVVVKPDTISNMASMIWGISPLMTKGMHPKKLNTIHPRETVTNPSLAKTSLSLVSSWSMQIPEGRTQRPPPGRYNQCFLFQQLLSYL